MEEAVAEGARPSDETLRLIDRVKEIPHAPACPGDVGCWCPLGKVLDMLEEYEVASFDRVTLMTVVAAVLVGVLSGVGAGFLVYLVVS